MSVGNFCEALVGHVRSEFGAEGFIPLHAPVFGPRDEQYVLEALRSGFVSSVGAHVQQFEQMVADFTGARFAIATVNGTAALHASLIVAGVGRDDEVLTQALTFVATCNAIRYCSAHPVFVDVDRRTLGMSAEALAEFLSRHAELRDDGLCYNRATGRVIRACVPMHNFGHPVRIDRIREVCDQYGIRLVEDAAESLGSTYRGQHTGLFGSHAALSFNGNKVITTGGGGMVITNDEEIARRTRHITTTAKLPHPWLYVHDEVGYNYRMPAINAALGCAQMEVLPSHLASKRALASRYAEWFSGQDFEFVVEPPDAVSNYWFNAFLANGRAERDEILKCTNERGVMTRPLWTPMHTLDLYKECYRDPLPNTEWLEARLVNLPSSAGMMGSPR